MKTPDSVALLCEIPEKDLSRGRIGTILKEILPGIFLIEFSDENGVALEFAEIREENLLVLSKSKLVQPEGWAQAWKEECNKRVEHDALEIIAKVGKQPPLSTDLMSFNNRKAIEEAGSGVCYHCLSWFQSERVTNWTDDGKTVLCPICGVDAVLANNTEPPISLEVLIDYQNANFSVTGLPNEEEVAEVRTQIEQIEKLKEQLANDLPGFLTANYPLFVETMLRHLEGTSVTDITAWLLYRHADGLKLLLSGGEKEIFKQAFEAAAGACA